MNSEILFERRGAAGIITLNRPKALNAVTHDMVRALTRQLGEWKHDGAVTRVTAPSSCHSPSWRVSARTMSWVTAFKALGRLRVMMPAAPRRSNRISEFIPAG